MVFFYVDDDYYDNRWFADAECSGLKHFKKAERIRLYYYFNDFSLNELIKERKYYSSLFDDKALEICEFLIHLIDHRKGLE